MKVENLALGLHPFERVVLPLLEKHPDVPTLAARAGLQEVEVTRGLQWLENKGLVVINTDEREFVDLDTHGQVYAKEGLPERRFLAALKDGPLSLSGLKQTNLSSDELNACVGLLKKRNAITVEKKKELMLSITKEGKSLLEGAFPEEEFLQRDFPVDMKTLSKPERKVLDDLKKRKGFVVVEKRRLKSATITPLGKKLLNEVDLDREVVDTVTPEMLRSAAWKGKPFRRYDVEINVPEVHGGKLQPYRLFLDWVCEKFVALGFEEMSGPLVESDFWDMDALFMPQFHSARDIHDAYYIKDAPRPKLPEKLVKRVKQVHETGGKTGSRGWRYEFDLDRTHDVLLRTQTTACSARMLGSGQVKIPGKYFAVARNFRYDVIDATHLPDFNQTEGIVLGEELNFRHLIGLLQLFAKEFADAEEVRIVPGYFPFTEPSAELFAKHPKLGWIELGGAGLFRPEVVEPLLGRYVPVLAWGLGIDRIAMLKLGLDDIRELFSHDLEFLRQARVV